MFGFMLEAYILENVQIPDRVSECFECLVSGARRRFLLKLFIGLTDDEIVYIMHAGLILISLPQYLTDGLINIILL